MATIATLKIQIKKYTNLVKLGCKKYILPLLDAEAKLEALEAVQAKPVAATAIADAPKTAPAKSVKSVKPLTATDIRNIISVLNSIYAVADDEVKDICYNIAWVIETGRLPGEYIQKLSKDIIKKYIKNTKPRYSEYKKSNATIDLMEYLNSIDSLSMSEVIALTQYARGGKFFPRKEYLKPHVVDSLKRKGIIFRGKLTPLGKSLLAGSEVGVAFHPVHFRYEEYLAKSLKQGYPTPEVQELISIARRNFLAAV